jgi:hypothetical protein
MATYEDARLVIDLVRWSTDIGLDNAMSEIFSKDFNAEDGTTNNQSVRKILIFGETVGSLVKHNVLDWDLLSDLFYIEGMWNQVAAHARHARESSGDSRLFEHFEAMAARGA